MQCMFVGGKVPTALLHRFPNKLNEIATVTCANRKEKNLEDAKEEQTIIMNYCGIPALRHVEALTGVTVRIQI